MTESQDEAAEQPVHPLLRPFVWLAAIVWLPLQKAGHLFVVFLHGYERGADAVGRAFMSGARAVGRAAVRLFRPLGGLFAFVAGVWRRFSLWALNYVFRPVGRRLQSAFERVEPAARRFVRVVDRGARRAWQALAPIAAAIAAAARRLAGPLARAVRRLALAVRRSARNLAAAVRAALSGRGVDPR
jgi:hypothetical protein